MLQAHAVDLAILDINLPGDKTGFGSLITSIHSIIFPFIFLTAHGDKATVKAAMAAQPYGYLMKPFEKVDLYTAIETAIINFTTRNRKKVAEKDSLVAKDSLFIKENHVFTK